MGEACRNLQFDRGSAEVTSRGNRRVLRPLIQLHGDDDARADLPVVEPHPQALLPQPLRQPAHAALVAGVGAQDPIEVEGVALWRSMARGVGASTRSFFVMVRFPEAC